MLWIEADEYILRKFFRKINFLFNRINVNLQLEDCTCSETKVNKQKRGEEDMKLTTQKSFNKRSKSSILKMIQIIIVV